MERRFDIGRIFWPLLVGSFSLAVIGAVVSIWVSTRPFLQEMQLRGLSTAAQLNATAAATYLERNAFSTAYFAADPVVVAHATGAVSRPERVIDRLDATKRPEELRSVHLFDFTGETVLYRGFGEAGERIDQRQAATDLARKTLAQTEAEGATDGQAASFGLQGQYALIAVPIISFGFVEGVLVSTIDLAPLRLSGTATHGIDAWLSSDSAPRDKNDIFVERLPGTDLFLHLSTSEADIDRVGYAMVRAGTLAVLASLLLPFSILATIGHRGILRPAEDLALSRDILRRQKKELAELAAIARRADDAIMITDLDGRVRWVNPAFEQMTGHSGNDLLGALYSSVMVPKEGDAKPARQLGAAFRDRQNTRLEMLCRHRSGPDFWIRLHVSPLLDEDGSEYGFVCISNDITKERADAAEIAKVQEAIKFQAMHDELTGLANRRYFNVEVERRMASESGAPLALIRLDLDHFKSVNDTLGHAAGDEVLETVASILRDETRGVDMPVRIGGDEFVVLLNPECRISAACCLAERLRRRVEGDRASGDVTVSIGIASSETGLLAPGDVLGAADAALYAAKEGGRNQIVVYDSELDKGIKASRAMEADLTQALARQEFEPFYQPKVDAITHEVVGLEVLGRWRHPTKGLLAPAAFMDDARRLGLLEAVDQQIMTRGLQDIRDLEADGFRVGIVAFNVTAERLSSPELLRLVSRHGMTHTRIGLEILESVFLEDDAGAMDAHIEQLHATGAQIEIDDFGSGHASVIAIMRVKPDVLKIDGRLVRDAIVSQKHRDILTAIISMAKSLKLGVVAEGVETLEHAALMRDMGCDILQGYAFARPMPVATLREEISDIQNWFRRTAS